MKIGPGTFRLILALTVVGYHLTRYVFIGHAAVYAFFILSGYWVSKMYENKYRPAKNGVWIYLLSRAWRIYPIYWLILLMAYVMNYMLHGWRYWYKIGEYGLWEQLQWGFSNITLLAYCQTNPQLLSPAWSLDIEMQFYLFLPLILWLCRRINVRWVLTFSILGMFYFLWAYGLMYRAFPKFLPYFIIGIAMAKGLQFNYVKSHISVLLLFVVLSIHYLVPPLYEMTVLGKFSAYNIHLSYVLPLVILPFIQKNVQVESRGNDAMFGALSYIVYLVHWVFILPYELYYRELSMLNRFPYLLVLLALTSVISLLIYYYFDQPNEKRRRRWIKKVL